MIGNAGERFDEQGNLIDANTKKHIRQLLESLVNWTRYHEKGRVVSA
jgi:hypothetical protein